MRLVLYSGKYNNIIWLIEIQQLLHWKNKSNVTCSLQPRSITFPPSVTFVKQTSTVSLLKKSSALSCIQHRPTVTELLHCWSNHNNTKLCLSTKIKNVSCITVNLVDDMEWWHKIKAGSSGSTKNYHMLFTFQSSLTLFRAKHKTFRSEINFLVWIIWFMIRSVKWISSAICG